MDYKNEDFSDILMLIKKVSREKNVSGNEVLEVIKNEYVHFFIPVYYRNIISYLFFILFASYLVLIHFLKY